MATLLTGARKYRIGLVLAHQELRKLWNQDRDVAGAVLSNAATRICFRVGDDDAKKLEDGFAGFTSRDIQNLGVGQAVCRVDRADSDFSLDALPPLVHAAEAAAHRERIVQASRERYGGKLAVVEPDVASSAEPEVVVLPRPERQRRAPEPERVEVPAPTPRAANHVAPEVLPGRGGAQHKYLQELIRRWADANGWRATVEKEILDGLGRVDIALERDDVSVACEIGCSTSMEHELENVQKCLAAGFTHVAALVIEKKRIGKMAVAVTTLPDELRERVIVAEAEGLFRFLDRFKMPENREAVVGGYRVSVRHQRPSDMAARRQAITRAIVGGMRRLQGK
jgi:hypothetical protein